MPSNVVASRPEIVWTIDLNATTATTAYPSGASAGIALPSTATVGGTGERLHVAMRYQVASGTMSTDCHLYGYTATTDGGHGYWAYLGGLNGSASITASPKWSESSTVILVQEVFELAQGQMSRFATRVVAPGGTTPIITTYIGYERA